MPGGQTPAAGPVDMAAFGEAFEVVGRLELEETDAAVVVQPMVTMGDGGLLVLTEPLEGQINVYDAEGRLQRVLGRKGQGPGEFQFPTGARLLASGEIVASDLMLQRMTFFPAAGEEGRGEPVVAPSPVPIVVGIHDLGDGRYLLTGPAAPDGRAPRLHIWDRATHDLVRSFLTTAVPDEGRAIAGSMPATSAAVEGDTIWAVWALADTLYKFDRQGERLAAIPIALPRPVGEIPRFQGGAAQDPRETAATLAQVTQVVEVRALAGGEKLVSALRSPASGPEWDMLILDREGREVWKAAHVPRLMATDGDRFHFADPESALPNRWLVAQRRAEGTDRVGAARPVEVGSGAAGPVEGGPALEGTADDRATAGPRNGRGAVGGRGLRAGDELPLSGMGVEAITPALVWSLDAASCLGCDLADPAYHVRKLQRRLGDDVATAIVAVSDLGEEDRPVVESFLAAQRLAGQLSIRSSAQHARLFQDGPVHAFYVVSSDGVVQADIPMDRSGSWRSSLDDLRLSDFAASTQPHN